MNSKSAHPPSCGLDFGTSNSSIAYNIGKEPLLTRLGKKAYIPSAIFFDLDVEKPFFGEEAIERYVDGKEGRMMWSPKNALGTNLINEKTFIRHQRVSFKDIIALIVRNLKSHCEEQAGVEIDSVVSGRPVRFNDDDKELDDQAQEALNQILRQAGFKNVEFEFEPIAAALHYERSINENQFAFIVDMGGGTSDFTVTRLDPSKKATADRSKSILSVGGIHIAGTDFDRQLSLKTLMTELGMGANYRSLEGPWLPVPPTIYFDLATWHKIGFAYTNKNIDFVRSKIYSSDSPHKFERLLQVLEYRFGHFFATLVEKAKINLSDQLSSFIKTDDVKPAISFEVTREQFEEAIDDHVSNIAKTVKTTISDAGISPSQINAIFMTGGSSLIPKVRSAITSIMPTAKLVEGDKFGSVAMGLAHLAKEKFL